MRAKELLLKAGYQIEEDFEVHEIQMDSRLIEPNDIFIALKGANTDGHNYIAQALEAGAKLVMSEREVPGYRTVVMEDGYKTLGKLAYYFYGEPTKDMEVIGVTGTNGKTTTTTLLYQSLCHAGRRVGLIGTNGLYYPEGSFPTSNTTPDGLLLMRYFKFFKEHDIHTVIMEVSSHALVLGRVDYVDFQYAVFTNLTQDHLDFHKDMEDYFNAKKMLFTDLNENAYAILNADDGTFGRLEKATQAKVVSYGVEHGQYQATQVHLNMYETSFEVAGMKISSDLLSIANVYNMLAVFATLRCMGYSLEKASELMHHLTHINGRLEKVYNQDFVAIVDYAHSPDSVRNILTFLAELKENRVIAIVGCGGDRDKSKRPKMARVACELADYAILTSDNPRTERPEAILEDMCEGLQSTNYCVIVDRKEAIGQAVKMARKGDIIAVLGKGHEDYQIVGTTKRHFSDKEEILKAIKGE